MSTTREEDSKSHKTFKIIVIGDSNVGKTSLTYRFFESKFITTLDVTIGFDLREKTLRVDGEDIKLQVWDTAGQERFRKSMVQQYYRKVHGIVLVYDVTNRASFDSLTYWLDECDRNCLTNVPKALVGNKCDEELVVDTNMAQSFADQYYMPLLFETSARFDSECDIVEAIFFFLAHKLKYQKQLIPVDDVGQTQRLTQAANPFNNNSGST